MNNDELIQFHVVFAHQAVPVEGSVVESPHSPICSQAIVQVMAVEIVPGTMLGEKCHLN
jgi:hypothetical protein